jgi:hypothetical protein
MRIKLNKYYWCKADMTAWKVIKISDNKVTLINKWNKEIEVNEEEFKKNYYIKPCQNWI